MEQTKEKKGFKTRLKEFFSQRKSRILPATLISLAIPLIIFISVPLENYTGNIGEMRFLFSDILGRAILCSLGVMAILFITQFIVPKTVYLVLRGLYLAVGLLLFMQANFLNFGLTTLAGDDAVTVVEMVGNTTVVINTIIWIVVIVGIITLSVFEKKLPIVKLIAFVLALIVFFPTCLTTTVNAATTDFSKGSAFEEMKNEDENYIPTFLTTENITSLGSDRNIVVFIIDRLDNQKYMNEGNGNTLNKYKGKYLDKWGGFTHFNDNISLYGRTYPSVAYMLTREKFNPELTRKEYFNEAYGNNKTLSKLDELGYSINIYTDTYYGYYDAFYLPDYIDNLQKASEESLYRETTQKHNLFRSNMMMSLYRLLPFAFKDTVGGISSSSMNKYVVYKSDELTHPEASTDLKDTWEAISTPQEPFSKEQTKKFTFIHVSGMHNVPYNENWGTAKGKDKKNLDISLTHSFNIIDEYISQMKDLGVYDNSTIIITGDHAYTDDNFSLLSMEKLTTLFVKPSSEHTGKMKTSEAPVSHEDLWATIFKSENIDYDKSIYGNSVFDIPENQDRDRNFIWHTVSRTQTSFTEDFYTIKGGKKSAKNFENWKVDKNNSKKYNRELYD